MDNDNVTKGVFDKTVQMMDERFARDKADIQNLEKEHHEMNERQIRIENLSIQMGEILKNHSGQLNEHEERISAIEKRPSTFWDKFIYALIGAAGSLAANGVFNAIFNK